MEKSPAKHEQVSFDDLGKALNKFEVENLFYYGLRSTRYMHDNREQSPLSDEEFAEWTERCPRPDDEAFAPFEEQHQISRQALADQLSVELDQLDGLIFAHQAETSRRMQCDSWRRSPEQEDRFPGMFVDAGVTHGNFAAGVITLANLTGESYRISNIGFHVGPVEEMYSYEVQPGQTLEEIFSDHKS